MKKISIILAALTFGLTSVSFAGNPDRAGSAGASQLLLNPWAKTSGMGFAASSYVQGAEAIFLNVAGLAFVKKTNIAFTTMNHLSGSGIRMNSVGLGKKVGDSGSLGLSISSMGFGDIETTTEGLPEGNIGTFAPTMSNISLAYAREFSNSIYGGIVVKVLSESVANASGSGVAFDAGIQYLTGAEENIHFGIALKNVGPPMRFGGDGLSKQVSLDDKELTVNQRADKFELPSLVNIGGAYDLILAGGNHVVTLAANFTSNSFTNDQYSFGVDYSFKSLFSLRAGYVTEENLNNENRTNIFTGLNAGASFNLMMNETNRLSFDYSYRDSDPFAGTHSIGVRVWLE